MLQLFFFIFFSPRSIIKGWIKKGKGLTTDISTDESLLEPLRREVQAFHNYDFGTEGKDSKVQDEYMTGLILTIQELLSDWVRKMLRKKKEEMGRKAAGEGKQDGEGKQVGEDEEVGVGEKSRTTSPFFQDFLDYRRVSGYIYYAFCCGKM